MDGDQACCAGQETLMQSECKKESAARADLQPPFQRLDTTQHEKTRLVAINSPDGVACALVRSDLA